MAALKTLPQPPEVCYNKGKGRGWDEGDRKPKRRALHADSRGERCFVATERAAEGHLTGGGTETRPHAAGDGFAGSNAGGGRFSAQAEDAAAAGVPVGTELVCPIPAAGPAGAEGQDKARLLIEGHTAGRLYYRCGQSSCSAAACTYSCAADCR